MINTRTILASSVLAGAIFSTNVNAFSMPSMPSLPTAEDAKNTADSVWNWKKDVTLPKTGLSFTVSTQRLAFVAGVLAFNKLAMKGNYLINPAKTFVSSVYGLTLAPVLAKAMDPKETAKEAWTAVSTVAQSVWGFTKTKAFDTRTYLESDQFSRMSNSFSVLMQASSYPLAVVAAWDVAKNYKSAPTVQMTMNNAGIPTEVASN